MNFAKNEKFHCNYINNRRNSQTNIIIPLLRSFAVILKCHVAITTNVQIQYLFSIVFRRVILLLLPSLRARYV